MKPYQRILKKLGFKLDWGEGNIYQFSNKKLFVQVMEKEDGYHEVSICPIKAFDRWSNSRHINFRLMVANYNSEKGYGWTQKNVEKHFRQQMKDAIWLCKRLPMRLFYECMKIDL